MSEHWSNSFWQMTPAKARSAGEVTLATTTNSNEELDDALKGRRIERQPQSWAAKQGFGHVLSDGTIEREETEISTDLPPARPGAGDDIDIVGPISRQQEAIALGNYQSGLQAAKSAYGDWEQVEQTPELIHQSLQRMVVAGLVNGPVVVRHLALHPNELKRLNGLAEKGFVQKAQRELEQLSVSLAQDGSVGMDHDSYREYRAKRDYQVRSRR